MPPDLGLPPEVDINGPGGSTGHSATEYDGVFADGVPVGIAMAASRHLESGGNYTVQAAGASASGAYQVIDSTWNNYGGYPRAYLAPPAVQDQFAYESFVALLKRYGNDVSMIPLSWYYPASISNPGLMDVVPMPEAGNVLTPRQYQTKWMEVFYGLLGQGAPPFLPANDPSEPYIRQIAFPVVGPTYFTDDWGFPRGDHGERSHEGTDLMTTSLQPLRAATDGTVTRVRYEDDGTAGVAISVTDSAGYRYNYFHVNDDNPGTTDGAAAAALRIHPDLGVGSIVQAGQVIAYAGDSGNAVGVPHLHFEIRTPSGDPFNPYPSLLAAQQREQCSVGIGPWSTAFVAPGSEAVVRPTIGKPDRPTTHTVRGPDGATWEVSDSGDVRATGTGAMIAPPTSEECTVVPNGIYGTNANGLSPNLLPVEWWDIAGAEKMWVPLPYARNDDPPNSI
ncbi:MAG: M23 family metallopeptidase [Actinomycetota bacterium]|nr:M23 family metallopeptidase [Actinomycetota bacterium]